MKLGVILGFVTSNWCDGEAGNESERASASYGKLDLNMIESDIGRISAGRKRYQVGNMKND